MKATINGITVEGTLEEVWSILQRHNAQGTNLKPKPPIPSTQLLTEAFNALNNYENKWSDTRG